MPSGGEGATAWDEVMPERRDRRTARCHRTPGVCDVTFVWRTVITAWCDVAGGRCDVGAAGGDRAVEIDDRLVTFDDDRSLIVDLEWRRCELRTEFAPKNAHSPEPSLP